MGFNSGFKGLSFILEGVIAVIVMERRHQQQSRKRDLVKTVTDRHVTKYNRPQNRTAKTWLVRLLFYWAQVVINLKKTLILQLNDWLTA